MPVVVLLAATLFALLAGISLAGLWLIRQARNALVEEAAGRPLSPAPRD
ncbi:hypothetical protein [Halomonas sp. C05BenzN]